MVGLRDLPPVFRRALAAAHALLCVLVVAVVTACAELPPCPVAKILSVPTSRGTVFVVDQWNLELLRLRMDGLHERTCTPGEFFAVDMRGAPD
jgi:hypothetical protein